MGSKDARRMDWSILESPLRNSTPADLKALEGLVAAARSGRLEAAVAAEERSAQKAAKKAKTAHAA